MWSIRANKTFGATLGTEARILPRSTCTLSLVGENCYSHLYFTWLLRRKAKLTNSKKPAPDHLLWTMMKKVFPDCFVTWVSKTAFWFSPAWTHFSVICNLESFLHSQEANKHTWQWCDCPHSHQISHIICLIGTWYLYMQGDGLNCSYWLCLLTLHSPSSDI